MTAMDDVVAHVVRELDADRGAPLTFYGHCAGAVTAFRVASDLLDRGVAVWRLAVGSCTAPGQLGTLAHVADRQIGAIERSLAGLGPVMPTALRAELEPALRADLRVMASGGTGAVLDCPISAFHGRDDRLLNSSDLTCWKEHTSGAFTFRQLPAGHFLLDTAADELADALVADIQRDSRSRPGRRVP